MHYYIIKYSNYTDKYIAKPIKPFNSIKSCMLQLADDIIK